MMVFITAMKESSFGFYVDGTCLMLLEQKDKSLALSGL